MNSEPKISKDMEKAMLVAMQAFILAAKDERIYMTDKGLEAIPDNEGPMQMFIEWDKPERFDMEPYFDIAEDMLGYEQAE